MKHNLIYLYTLLATIWLAGCGGSALSDPNEQSEEAVAPTETRRENLEGSRVSFEVPVDYTRSRKYLLEKDIINYDPAFYDIFDEMLYQLEREDEDQDIFADTTDNFDHIVIRTVNKMELTEDRAKLYAANLEQFVEERAGKRRGLNTELLSTTLNEGNGKIMLKIKHKHTTNKEPKEFYETVYFITDAVQTFVISEYHRDEDDLERNFWRMTY
ncbi:MAG: hypothetical protein AAF741_03050 [Bacteroidota bacterium]